MFLASASQLPSGNPLQICNGLCPRHMCTSQAYSQPVIMLTSLAANARIAISAIQSLLLYGKLYRILNQCEFKTVLMALTMLPMPD